MRAPPYPRSVLPTLIYSKNAATSADLADVCAILSSILVYITVIGQTL